MGRQAAVRKRPVDAFGLRLNLGEEIVIALDVGSARRPDFDEGKLPPVGRVPVKEPFESPQTFGNSLGVINAVDANPHETCLDAEFLE